VRKRQETVASLDQRLAELQAAQLIRRGVDLVGTTPLKTADIPAAQLHEIALATATPTVRPTEQIAQNTASIAETVKDILTTIQQNHPAGTTGTTTPAGPLTSTAGSADIDVVTRLMNAIIGQESTRNYRAVNPDSGALGFGQVMPANVPSWTKAALGSSLTPEQFLADPEAQVKTIQFHVNQMYQDAIAATGGNMELAVRRVAAEWYSGKPGLLESTKSQGRYPTIQSYTEQVLQRFLGSAGTLTTTNDTAPAPLIDEQETQRRIQKSKEILAQFRPPPPTDDDVIRITTSEVPAISTLIGKTKEYKDLLAKDLAASLKDINSDFHTQEAVIQSVGKRYEELKEGARTLAQLRAEEADADLVALRRLHEAQSEEIDLTQQRIHLEDELANGPLNESLRIQVALLQDIASVRRRDEDAIKAQNRAQLELAEGEVFHGEQARAKVLEHLAQSRTETEVFADAIIEAYEGINDVVLHGVEKITGGIKILDNLIAGLVTRLTNRLFQKLLDVLIPSSSGQGGGITSIAGPGGTSGGGGIFNSVLGFLRGGGSSSGPSLSFGNLASLVGATPGGGGLSAPLSLTSQLAQQDALSSAIHEAGHTSLSSTAATGLAAGSSGFSLAGLGASLAPLLGITFGASLGKSSPVGSILGGVGGGIAGLGLAALLGSSTAASAFGSIATIGGLLPFALPILPIAGALLVGAYFLSRNAARRRDEKSRNQSMLDSLGQLNQILVAVKSDRMDGGQAIAAAVQIRAQYLTAMGELKDKKTREIALKDVSRLDVVINQIRNEANAQLNRKEIDRKLVPEFAKGTERGLVPYMGGRRTLIKVRPGERIDDVGLAESFFVPGIDRGVDSVFTVATPGSRVLTRLQQPRVPAYANGTPAALPSAESDRPISLTLNINLPGMKPGVLAEQIVKSPEGREAIVKLVQIENRDGRFN
jgi:hypothetical protein